MAATQDGLDIPFSSSHNQQTLKLLELPNELLKLLQSDDPPTLKLETDPKTSLALLSAPGLKYRVQQKNSSNKILILNPTTTRSSIPNTTLDTEEPAVTIISKIEDTLELLEYKEEDVKEKKVNKWHEKFAKGRKK